MVVDLKCKNNHAILLGLGLDSRAYLHYKTQLHTTYCSLYFEHRAGHSHNKINWRFSNVFRLLVIVDRSRINRQRVTHMNN